MPNHPNSLFAPLLAALAAALALPACSNEPTRRKLRSGAPAAAAGTPAIRGVTLHPPLPAGFVGDDHGTPFPLLDGVDADGASGFGYRLVPSIQVCDGALAYDASVPSSAAPELTEGAQLKICVKATTAAGDLFSGSAPFTVDRTAPAATGSATAKARADASVVDVSWTAAADAGTPGPQIAYDVYASTGAPVGTIAAVKAGAKLAGTVTGATAFAVDKAEPNALYRFYVVARDLAGNEALYPEATLLTPLNSAKTFAGSLALSFDAGKIALQWPAAVAAGASWVSADKADSSYLVYRKIGAAFADPSRPAADGELLGRTGELQFADAAPQEGMTHYYAVCVAGAAGELACLADTKGIAPDLTPPALSDLTVTALEVAGKWRIAWTAADAAAPTAPLTVRLLAADKEVATASGVTTLDVSESSATMVQYSLEVRDAAGNAAVARFGLAQAEAFFINAIRRPNGPVDGGKLAYVKGGGFPNEITVALGDTRCAAEFRWSSSAVGCTTPPHQSGALPVRITAASGIEASLPRAYEFLTGSTALCDKPKPTAADFAAGTGTAADPFVLCDGQQLDALRSYVTGSWYFRLAENIDLSAIPAHTRAPLDVNLTDGVFDGGGFVVAGLKSGRNSANYTGLFGQATNLSFVNLGVVGLYEDMDPGANAAGGLASVLDGTWTGRVLRNVFVAGTVYGRASVGGVAGIVTGPVVVEDVSFDGSVHALYRNVGGLFGKLSNATVTRVRVAGEVVSEGSNLAGFAGGLVGEASATAFDHCAFSGKVQTGDVLAAGGVANNVGGSVFTDCDFRAVDLNSIDSTGGVVGNSGGPLTITRTTVTGKASGGYRIGGLVGSIQGGSGVAVRIAASHTNVAISQTVGEVAGGLVGESSAVDPIVIVDCSAAGAVTGRSQVGGAIGHLVSGKLDSVLTTADVMGVNDVGGLIGWFQGAGDSHVRQASLRGKVTGTARVGGVAGRLDSGATTPWPADPIFDQIFFSGVVSGQSSVGGITAYLSPSTGQVLGPSAYVFGNAGDMAGGIGGTVVTKAAMALPATFVGFDFTAIWAAGGANGPDLRLSSCPTWLAGPGSGCAQK